MKEKNPLRLARLDYILIFESLSNVINNISIKPGYRSDHSAVIMEIKFNSFTKGHGLWKFNNSLLHDEVYVEKVKQTIQLVKETFLKNPTNYADDLYYFYTIDDSTFLEILLMEIRGINISYASYKKKEREKQEKLLYEEIEQLESEQPLNTPMLEEKRLSLEKIRKTKMQGQLIRSRTRWVEEGEKPNKYFCNLESRNFINKTIKRVDVGNDMIIYDQFEILKRIKSFYETLYTDYDTDLIDIDLNDIIDNTYVKKLDDHTSKLLEKNISESEILDVLKNMKNNQSPGSDGFTAEFFKFFWNDLKCFILQAINCIFTKKKPINYYLLPKDLV